MPKSSNQILNVFVLKLEKHNAYQVKLLIQQSGFTLVEHTYMIGQDKQNLTQTKPHQSLLVLKSWET